MIEGEFRGALGGMFAGSGDKIAATRPPNSAPLLCPAVRVLNCIYSFLTALAVRTHGPQVSASLRFLLVGLLHGTSPESQPLPLLLGLAAS